MKNTYLQANLISLTRINLLLFTGIPLPHNLKFILEEDGTSTSLLMVHRRISNNNISIYELDMDHDFIYGHSYVVVLEGFFRVNVEVSEATNFPGFDEKFYYDGDDLGSIYSKEETRFALWAPLASEAEVEIEEKDGFHLYKMNRSDKGVFRLTLKGDQLNKKYRYAVTNSGIKNYSTDPYGKGVSLNSEYSVVIDLSIITKMKAESPKTIIRKNSDAIIYETSIRDFSEDKNTDIVHKGQYLGLCEENRKTLKGHPAGLDYLKFLGITHLQILPVIDFYGNDDLDNSKMYNWGYNPISFFAIEGSYATKPEEAINRLIEFKTMVETLHKHDIRVVMDVVYNHVYEYMYTSFEKIVPNYFFRRRTNGAISTASGCGDDFASEKKMARKMILDSLEYFVKVFNVDGFRFDLMGLLDIDTINQGYQICKKYKKDILYYGEGWNMGYELPFEKKACSDNADKMPGVAFFNDLYRDTIRGGNFRDNITTKGFVGGNISRNDIVNYVIKGSTMDIPFNHRFKDVNQSLNYVECHDNNTLYDKLTFSNEGEDEATLLNRVKFANEVVLLSFGIPFIHMGQEIGLSKSGLDNTYNVLKVNNMDWKLVDDRFEMVEDVARYINFRKYFQKNFHLYDDNGLPTILDVQYWGNGVLAYASDKKENIDGNQKVAVLINATLDSKTYELDDYYTLFIDTKGDSGCNNTKNGILSPLSVQFLYVKKDEK